MAANHAHMHQIAGKRLVVACALTALVLGVELAGGFVAHSLALLSDAGHVLTDVVALAFAWFAAAQATRPANDRKTYGYHRTGILIALANAATLIAIVLAIGFEAVPRLRHPVPVTPWLIVVAAGVGVAVNLYIGASLHGLGSANLNVRAALLHVLGDLGAGVGVIAGGAVIALTGWYPLDPLVSLFIALLIARGAWGILRETLDILMEATPKGLNVLELVADMRRQPGITGVHDLHVWSIAGGMRALSAHVRVQDCQLSACDDLLGDLNRVLAQRYQIGHSTIQFECAGCEPPELYCTLNPDPAAGHAHANGNGRQTSAPENVKAQG
jgi:cobalt-zinc-cadmium efflux system protein